jgi:Transcription initiation factor IID, 18kD subunit
LKGIGAVTAEDIMAIVKKDPKKFERVKELFELQKELKEARATFEVPDGLLDTEALASLAKDVADEASAGTAGEGQA